MSVCLIVNAAGAAELGPYLEGRSNYFTQHGADRIYDYYTAIEDGIVPESYFAWRGFEDSILFDYAKDALTEIAKGDTPFTFTLLTADTHYIGGYLCGLCGFIPDCIYLL